jgi:hypothetical protein
MGIVGIVISFTSRSRDGNSRQQAMLRVSLSRFRGAARPGHVRYDFSGFSLVRQVLGSGKVADRAGSQVGQMVLARGLRSAGFRDPDDLYLENTAAAKLKMLPG